MCLKSCFSVTKPYDQIRQTNPTKDCSWISGLPWVDRLQLTLTTMILHFGFLRCWADSFHHKLWMFDSPKCGQSIKGEQSLQFLLGFQKYIFREKVYFIHVSEAPNLTSPLCKRYSYKKESENQITLQVTRRRKRQCTLSLCKMCLKYQLFDFGKWVWKNTWWLLIFGMTLGSMKVYLSHASDACITE